MKRVWTLLTVLAYLAVCVIGAVALSPVAAAQSASPVSLRGTVTDPSGASVPGAIVQLLGPGGQQRAKTDELGKYTLRSVPPGKYRVRVIAKGFTVNEHADYEISGPAVLDVQLVIAAEAQVMNVEDEANSVGVDPETNGGALVLKEKELAALSDDPDELEQQLQAMAGPSTGPNGGQIYIDGFTGGNLPPKSSIREVRINSNPYSTEYDRPGFGRIEILTKPGTDFLRGQAFMQYNKEALNSRSPLLGQSKRPPYKNEFFGFNVSGPIKKQKASFGLDFEHRIIDENAFILATTLDSNLNVVPINQGVLTPQSRTTFTPRIDYTINPSNTLVVRYQNTRISLDKTGIGDFNLISQAYAQKETEQTVQITETAVLSPKAINETRLQFMRTRTSDTANSTMPALIVQGAFTDGGPQIGNSGNITNRAELTNISTYTHGTHTIKWGGRLRQSFIDDTSVNNFGGTYTFFGGLGPALDANNMPIGGIPATPCMQGDPNCINLSALERYRRTLLFQRQPQPPSPAEIRLLGGGASQFSLNAGKPLTSVNQFDAGLFMNDDWRMRPNLTFSYGLRYEVQTHAGDPLDLTPRLGIAWGIDGGANKQAKTVLRAGFGSFFDRLADTLTLQAQRYNGKTQLSYLILNPDSYPTIPSLSMLATSQQAQQLQVIYRGIQSPRTYQASVGLDRQINKYARFSVNYVTSRGIHLLRTRNINAPIDKSFPLGNPDIVLLNESTGRSRTNQLIISPNVNYKKIFLFGFYSLSYGWDDNEGEPADPYNLRAEWGPSTTGDVRHRFLVGSSLPLPLKFTISPFFFASSGTPYNITTGTDPNHTGFSTERPALLTGVGAADCSSGDRVYTTEFGCFNLNPTPGTPTIRRNFARGPGTANLSLRLSRAWAFGKSNESSAGDGMPPGMGGVRGNPMGEGRGRGPGGPGGPPPGMFGANTGKKYNLILTISARNALNHPNYAPPSGDLSSPFFGQFRSLAGFGPFGANTTYNRKVDLQLRFTF